METMRICGYCQTKKDFIFSGKKMSDGSKLYTDATGSRWSGKRCPECERQRVQAAIKFDAFDKNLLIHQIESQGYKVLTFKDIITAEKDGSKYTFSARRGATTKDGQIVLDGVHSQDTDFTIILFQSSRICSREQMGKLIPSAQNFTHLPNPRPRKEFAKQEGRTFDAQEKI
jgi:hypothetical protein